MSSSVAKIAKPEMRRLMQGQIKKNFLITAVGVAITGICYRVFVHDVRKNKYAEFYKTYDADAAFERMRKRGVFESCPAD